MSEIGKIGEEVIRRIRKMSVTTEQLSDETVAIIAGVTLGVVADRTNIPTSPRKKETVPHTAVEKHRPKPYKVGVEQCAGCPLDKCEFPKERKNQKRTK